ncbi:hypothetical protein WN55_07157 [Dufourea novaeangliae]|uniref:Uncharacterized protein n=2 Tax=Dufourea novaeangliae TaxID=178035 RepID=A0A154P2G9_DUFNO|nr:hypothetical protein WN55_07157 [Dufourea novaeangliae]
MFFINDGKTQRSFCDLMKKKEKKPLHLQECRIMLQKLTEEETKLYTNGKHLVEQPRKNQYISQQSLSQSSESRSVNSKPTWRIRIPKSVLNESQNEIDNSNSNESSNPMHIMRTRTSYR